MRKDNITRRASGFTLAELMISMLITMVVLTAMVPIVGPKKITRQHNKTIHGIYECFYTMSDDGYDFTDIDDHVAVYHADDKNSDGFAGEGGKGYWWQHLDKSDHCTFYPPKADYYEIIVIGAGGAGHNWVDLAGKNKAANPEVSEKVVKEGVIRIDNNYQNDIEAVGTAIEDELMPGKIRSAINKWKGNAVKSDSSKATDDLRAIYTKITSPIGRGGLANCMVQKWPVDGSVCDVACQPGKICPGPAEGTWSKTFSSLAAGYDAIKNSGYTKCWFYLSGGGSSSGSQLESTKPVKLKLEGNTIIDLYTKNPNSSGDDDLYETKIELSGYGDGHRNIVKLESPEHGEDAVFNGSTMGATGKAVADAKCTSEIYSNHTDICSTHFKTNGVKGLSAGEADTHGSAMSCSAKAGEMQKPGVIKYSKEPITWKYTDVFLNIAYGQKGTPGEVKSIVYEKLNGPIYLFPAKGIDSISKVSYKEDGSNPFITASSGKNGEWVYKASVIGSNDNLPYPQDLVTKSTADNATSMAYVMSVLKSSPYKKGIARCMISGIDHNASTNNLYDACRPGYATSGWYPYYNFGGDKYHVFKGNAKMTIKDNQAGGTDASYTIPIEKKYTDSSLTDYKCADGKTAASENEIYSYADADGKYSQYWKGYCQNNADDSYGARTHKPGRGAIIIVW